LGKQQFANWSANLHSFSVIQHIQNPKQNEAWPDHRSKSLESETDPLVFGQMRFRNYYHVLAPFEAGNDSEEGSSIDSNGSTAASDSNTGTQITEDIAKSDDGAISAAIEL
jgi:hypothetical protein